MSETLIITERDHCPLTGDQPDQRKFRYFIRNPNSGEPWSYCGDRDDAPQLARAFGDFVNGEIDNDFGGEEGVSDRFTIEVKRVAMIDAEAAAIPEM